LRLTVAALLTVPEVPVTTIVAAPGAAAAFAVKVRMLIPAAGPRVNEALTPAGRPAAERATIPLKPFRAPTVILVLALVPGPRLRLVGEAVIV
jgi:hypothetical protein